LAKVKPAGASTANGVGPLMWVLSVALLAVTAILWWFWNRRRQARLDGS
jgi:lysozyme family protein